ncbi:hypothetical protein CEXT_271111 [Caerostris extrusa]|uniref:Uncharacterized protein n=1 Tax=Caerostris extrusa TaxID=172846 RepID=A0AAV4YB98_CAEEX|nr:hypothetical protein CEXT_271111 [Caerostris extrusa]
MARRNSLRMCVYASFLSQDEQREQKRESMESARSLDPCHPTSLEFIHFGTLIQSFLSAGNLKLQASMDRRRETSKNFELLEIEFSPARHTGNMTIGRVRRTLTWALREGGRSPRKSSAGKCPRQRQNRGNVAMTTDTCCGGMGMNT